ncbi:MAG: TetR/AcrR family transcriptional regulator [Arenicellales bacterium]
MAKRRYTKRRRAEQEEDTRKRILEAAVALHGELGPRDTTISAIAERAGVQRLTVYRHFPDDYALFRACTSHWLASNPPPDPDLWAQGGDPRKLTHDGLASLYAYYRQTSYMWRLSYRDYDEVPALQGPMREFEQYLDRIRDRLFDAWAPSRGRAAAVRAVLGHCLRYSTWRSLADEGLGDEGIADLMAAWLDGLATARRETAEAADR